MFVAAQNPIDGNWHFNKKALVFAPVIALTSAVALRGFSTPFLSFFAKPSFGTACAITSLRLGLINVGTFIDTILDRGVTLKFCKTDESGIAQTEKLGNGKINLIPKDEYSTWTVISAFCVSTLIVISGVAFSIFKMYSYMDIPLSWKQLLVCEVALFGIMAMTAAIEELTGKPITSLVN